jgi:hypothetical protein
MLSMYIAWNICILHENCFKMKLVYSFDNFSFFVPRLLLMGVEEEKGLGAFGF